jgi:hypothetical protein
MMHEIDINDYPAERMLSNISGRFKQPKFLEDQIIYTHHWGDILNTKWSPGLCFIRICGDFKGWNLPLISDNIISQKWHYALTQAQKVIDLEFEQNPVTCFDEPLLSASERIKIWIFDVLIRLPQPIVNSIFTLMSPEASLERTMVRKIANPHFERIYSNLNSGISKP